MITDFPPEQKAKLDAFDGWQEFVDEQPNVKRISEGHYWDSFTVNLLLRNEIEEFHFSNQTRANMQELFAILDDESLTGEQKDEQAEPLRQRINELLEGPPDYGVCDSPEQVLETWPSLVTDENRFVILFREINRDECPDWRWHKNGRYIGNQNAQYEHLGDEDESIQRVLTFSVVRLK
jgi:hypothetical protein